MSTHWTLYLIHLLYAVFTTISTWLQRYKRKQPKPLQAQRSKIPKHLCLSLVANDDIPVEDTEAIFLQCLQNVSAWCRVLGIEALTVYDRHGVLCRCSENAYRRVFLVNETSEDSCESEVEYPLTPPPSESSGSRSHSCEREALPADLNVITMLPQSHIRKRRNVAVRKQSRGVSSASRNLTLYIVSRASGKPAIASASRLLLKSRIGDALMLDGTAPSELGCKLTVSELASVLEAGLPPPDFMIVHHIGNMKMPQSPLELHGFPPWQTTLTEFHRTHPEDRDPHSSVNVPGMVSEAAFCRALDEYSRAEFRLGK